MDPRADLRRASIRNLTVPQSATRNRGTTNFPHTIAVREADSDCLAVFFQRRLSAALVAHHSLDHAFTRLGDLTFLAEPIGTVSADFACLASDFDGYELAHLVIAFAAGRHCATLLASRCRCTHVDRGIERRALCASSPDFFDGRPKAGTTGGTVTLHHHDRVAVCRPAARRRASELGAPAGER